MNQKYFYTNYVLTTNWSMKIHTPQMKTFGLMNINTSSKDYCFIPYYIKKILEKLSEG